LIRPFARPDNAMTKDSAVFNMRYNLVFEWILKKSEHSLGTVERERKETRKVARNKKILE
jgi:hypothetical protein